MTDKQFYINTLLWQVREEPNDVIKVDSQEYGQDDTEFYYGICLYPIQTIEINEDLCKDQKIRTLKHEIVHAWLYSWGMRKEDYTEEELCEIFANNGTNIESLVQAILEEEKPLTEEIENE